MGLHEGTQEVLAPTHLGRLGLVGQLDRSDSGIGCGAVHLYLVLVDSALDVGCRVGTPPDEPTEIQVLLCIRRGANRLMTAVTLDDLGE
jgi:hypothetical protein